MCSRSNSINTDTRTGQHGVKVKIELKDSLNTVDYDNDNEQGFKSMNPTNTCLSIHP